ncbi:MAG: hypothetical protein LBF38_11875, partial [Deltaproteobacteria bacterium]|nr:hypothetical protein [Deltaproteobacteria bacterium]
NPINPQKFFLASDGQLPRLSPTLISSQHVTKITKVIFDTQIIEIIFVIKLFSLWWGILWLNKSRDWGLRQKVGAGAVWDTKAG